MSRKSINYLKKVQYILDRVQDWLTDIPSTAKAFRNLKQIPRPERDLGGLQS